VARRVVRVSRGARRKVGWSFGPSSGTNGSAQAISASGAVIFGTAAAAQNDGLTVVRLRGVFAARITASSGASAGFFGAIGIAKATAAAIAAGVASVPTPMTEGGWDGWLYHHFIHVFAQSATLGDSDQEVLRLIVDSKAMRKLSIDESLYGALEVTEVGTASMDVNFDSRVLTKLP